MQPTGNLTSVFTFLGLEKEARSPSLGCLMVTLPPQAAEKTLTFAQANIPEDQLAEDGIETEPHATVLYGLDNSLSLGDLDPPKTPIKLSLGKIKRFKADANRPGSDVLVIEVISPAMTELNANLKSVFKVTSTYNTYNPHVTLAYVQPGALPELDGSDNFAGETFIADELVLSRTVNGERDKTTMHLSDKSASVLNLLGLEKEAARPHFARSVGVGIAGSIPGRILGDLLVDQLAKRKMISSADSMTGDAIRGGATGLGAGLAQAIDGQFQDHKWDDNGRKIKRKKEDTPEEPPVPKAKAKEHAKAAAIARGWCQGELAAHLKRASGEQFQSPTVPYGYDPEAPIVTADEANASSNPRWDSILAMLLGLLGGGGGKPAPQAAPPPPPRGTLESILGGPPGGKLIPQPEAEAAVAKLDAAEKVRTQPVAGPMGGGSDDEPVGIRKALAAAKPVTGPPVPPPKPPPASSGAMGGGEDDPVGLRGVGIKFDDEKTNLARGKALAEFVTDFAGPVWAGGAAGSLMNWAGDRMANSGVPDDQRKELIKPIEHIDNIDDTPLPFETRAGNSWGDSFWKAKYNPLTPVARTAANTLGNARISAQNSFKDPFSDEDFGVREGPPPPPKLRPPPKPYKPTVIPPIAGTTHKFR
jgi:hypothetical protein